MKVYDAYNALTDIGKREAIAAVVKQLEAGGKPVSTDYIKQVMLGLRQSPCSQPIARAISAYFTGFLRIEMSEAEVVPVERNSRHAAAR